MNDYVTELRKMGENNYFLYSTRELCKRAANEIDHLRSTNVMLSRKLDAAQAEVQLLRTAFALAVGELSTYSEHRLTTPDLLMQQFLQEARQQD